MKKIIQIAMKDFSQSMRSPITLVWTVALPLVFTGFLGAVFGGIGGSNESAIPLGTLDRGAQPDLVYQLRDEMDVSALIDWTDYTDEADMRGDIINGQLAGGLIFPENAGIDTMFEPGKQVILVADTTTSTGIAMEANLRRAVNQMISANRIAQTIIAEVGKAHPYASEEAADSAETNLRSKANDAWQSPAVTIISEPAALAKTDLSTLENSYDQSAPGMMVQFTINSLVGTAIVIVLERKTRTMQRLLTYSLSNTQILAGHALYIFTLAFVQQSLLVIGGQFIYGVNYLRDPAAIWLIITGFSLWVSGLGLLIGVLAKNTEQVILYSLLAMFFFTAMAGAWFPLEGTSPVFNRIGHLTPGAWAMDGLQNVIVRGLGVQAAIKPAGILALFALVFYAAGLLFFWLDWRKAR